MIKTNYYLDKRENEVKQAVGLVQVDTKMSEATLYIGKSRELILAGQYYEKMKLRVVFDRNGNPFEQAYNTFRNLEIVKNIDGEEIVEKPFADWYNFYE